VPQTVLAARLAPKLNGNATTNTAQIGISVPRKAPPIPGDTDRELATIRATSRHTSMPLGPGTASVRMKSSPPSAPGMARSIAPPDTRSAPSGDQGVPEASLRMPTPRPFEREAKTLATLNHPHIAQIPVGKSAVSRRSS